MTPCEYDKSSLRRLLPSRPPVFARVGRAAERLRRLAAYRKARVVLVMPDEVLLQVRINLLGDGKTLVAATPGLKQGLVRIVPAQVPVARRRRELAGGALFKAGTHLRFPRARLGRVDLVVGAVLAVDRQGHTLGDGRGLLDLTCAILGHLGCLTPQTPLAVLVHGEQLRDRLPSDSWDVRAGIIVTPDQVLTPRVEQPHPSLERLPPRLRSLPVVQAVRGLGRGSAASPEPGGRGQGRRGATS